MSKYGASSNADAESFNSLEEKFKNLHIDAALQRSKEAAERRSELSKDYNHHDTEEYYHLEALRDALTAQLLYAKQELAVMQLLSSMKQPSELPSKPEAQSSVPLPTLESLIPTVKVELSALEHEQIDAKVREAAALQVENLQLFTSIERRFQHKAELAKKVLNEIKNKLGETPATKELVGKFAQEWLDEIEVSQKIASGISKGEVKKSTIPESIQSPLLKAYLAFILRPKIKILDAIAAEIRRLQVGDEPGNQKLLEAILHDVKEEQIKVEKERVARLTQIAPHKDFVAKVIAWFENIPASLTYTQMRERDELRAFEPLQEESSTDRVKAISRVEGYHPRVEQRKNKAISFSLAKTHRKEKHTVERQMGELSESMRLENQNELGIFPQSLSRKPLLTAATHLLSGPSYETKFHNARLDETASPEFPKRKLHAQELAKDFVSRHQRIEALVQGAKVEATDKPLEEAVGKVKKFTLR
jgi:hypothetical protein